MHLVPDALDELYEEESLNLRNAQRADVTDSINSDFAKDEESKDTPVKDWRQKSAEEILDEALTD